MKKTTILELRIISIIDYADEVITPTCDGCNLCEQIIRAFDPDNELSEVKATCKRPCHVEKQ